MTEGELGQSNATDKEMKSDAQREAEAESEIVDQDSNELKLAPEIEALVMDKVQDIDKRGVAFTSLYFFRKYGDKEYKERFASLLRDGLLGSGDFRGEKPYLIEDSVERRNLWHSQVKKVRETGNLLLSQVWFNIVGRMADVRDEKQIDSSRPISTSYDKECVVLTFDISNLKELPSGTLHTPESFNLYLDELGIKTKVGGKTFAGNGGFEGYDYYAPYGVDSSFGFETNFRVAPRRFNGLVVKNMSQAKLEDYISLMIKDGKTILPVYDMVGNLLWPKQMNYEEVKVFVAERDAKKAAESQSQVIENGQTINVENNELDSGSSPE